MILRDSYSQAPGHCRLCHSAQVPTIDTERDYDSDGFGGVLYICINCARNIAGLINWSDPSSVEDLREDIRRQAELIDQLETETADVAAELQTLKDTVTIVSATPRRGPGRPRKTDA